MFNKNVKNAKTIKEWQKLFANAINKKFGSSSQGKRISFIKQEVDDIENALKVEKGELKSDDHRYQDPNERIAGLLANVFVLSDQRGTDLDKELQKALDSFLAPNTRPSSDIKKPTRDDI